MMGNIIKAENIREARFVFADNTRCVHAALMRSNGTCIEVNAAMVDRLLDEHDELLDLRRRNQEYELFIGQTVDIGCEASVFVRLDEIQCIVEIPPIAGMQDMQAAVVLKKDGLGIMCRTSRENLIDRIQRIRRDRAERGN